MNGNLKKIIITTIKDVVSSAPILYFLPGREPVDSCAAYPSAAGSQIEQRAPHMPTLHAG